MLFLLAEILVFQTGERDERKFGSFLYLEIHKQPQSDTFTLDGT